MKRKLIYGMLSVNLHKKYKTYLTLQFRIFGLVGKMKVVIFTGATTAQSA